VHAIPNYVTTKALGYESLWNFSIAAEVTFLRINYLIEIVKTEDMVSLYLSQAENQVIIYT
jgi:hypothetical protein